jgi:SAM-dependent methyltransferase
MESVEPKDQDVNQFVRPHGFLGRVAGLLMALLNADMERVVVSAPPLDERASVLEIGFGPGIGIRLLARRLPGGFVAGIDPSDVMLRQATARNRDGVRSGRVDLRLGTSSHLPWEAARFDAVCTVNNVHFWPSLADDLREVRRVLRPSGFLSIGVHAWADAHALDRGDRGRPWRDHIVASLDRARYEVLRSSESRARSGRALYFLARAI